MPAEKKRLDGGPEEISILFEVSQILDSSLDLRTVVSLSWRLSRGPCA